MCQFMVRKIRDLFIHIPWGVCWNDEQETIVAIVIIIASIFIVIIVNVIVCFTCCDGILG